jgi:branched-chain amino acid transport system substrate-binding protein
MNNTIRALVGLLLAGLIANPGVMRRAEAAGAAPIVIAHAAPTTGRFALHSEADRRGIEMAIEEFNARGGVLGRPLVLISNDPSAGNRQPADVAEELITVNHIGFMVGAIDSGIAAALSAVCQKHGVIFINTNSSAPSESVENAHRTKFVFDASAANVNRALLGYALARQKSKRVVLLTEDNPWGHSSAEASRGYIAQYGGKVVGEVVVPATLPDPAGALRDVAAIRADVVAVNISGNNQIRLFAQIDPKTLERQSWVVGEVDWEELYPAPGTPRPLFATTWAWNFNTPGTAEFVARYRKLYGQTRLDYPGDVTHAAYIATRTLLTAIERAGTTDNHAIIGELEKFKWGARERMQNSAAWMDPVSHHVQQDVYIARWNPRVEHPENGIEVLGHFPPAKARYDQERTTRLESLADTPHYVP